MPIAHSSISSATISVPSALRGYIVDISDFINEYISLNWQDGKLVTKRFFWHFDFYATGMVIYDSYYAVRIIYFIRVVV